MMDNDYYKNEGFVFDHIQAPKYEWKCFINHNTYFCFEEGKQPNAFHRFMQKLILGFKWVRTNEK